MISLRLVTKDNIEEIIALEVQEKQKDFVLSNVISIAQAYVQPECKPVAIYENDTPVGFMMYCIDSDDDEYWIYRLMIDQKFQRQGFAKKATELMIKEIKKDKSRNKIFLGLDQKNECAAKLYQSLEFKFNGQAFGKEQIMVLEY